MIVKPGEDHKHVFDIPLETIVPLRKVVKENGQTIRDTITGRDVLKQRKCKCGQVETYDLERTVA